MQDILIFAAGAVVGVIIGLFVAGCCITASKGEGGPVE
jgi:hypothetical protein